MKNFSKLWVGVASILISPTLNSQTNYWAWMQGSATTTSLTPVYGTLGVSSPANSPGSRRSPVTITDNSGNLWLFGGSNGAATYKNDLWRYNINTGQWTWVSGPSTNNSLGLHGTQGTPSSTNIPGGRYLSTGWFDTGGNLWIFGGYGYSGVSGPTYLNDLWKYDITLNQWTWVKGNSGAATYGTYGTQGFSSVLNTPGGRYSCMAGKDTSNNFYLFGGTGYGSSTSGSLCDLWKYNPATNAWTWLKGAGVSNQFATFGTQGVASASNNPGGRYAGSGCSDAAGNLWIFGGYGMINSGTGYLNELWKYDAASANWIWVNGATVANQSGYYGSQGVATSLNSAGSRIFYSNSSLVDMTGNLWIFGGYGYSSGGAGYLNDLWRFNSSTGQWVWMKGSASPNQYAQFGSQGVGASPNVPGSRYFQSSWKDNSGNFWVYGGIGYSGTTSGDLSDLWKFDLCAIPLIPVSSTQSVNLSRCSGATTTLSASSGTVPVSWYSSLTSTNALGNGTSYITSPLSAIGASSVYSFYAEAMTCGPSAARAAFNVTVHPAPVISVNSGTICSGGIFAMLPSGAATYTYSGGSQLVSPQTNTSYLVSGSSLAGCISTVSAVANVTVFPMPLITVNSGTICEGNSFTINPAGAVSYTVSGSSAVVTPTTSSFYFVYGTSASGCISSTPAVSGVIVSPLPVIASNSGTMCEGGSYLIQPSGASTYSITGGSFNVSPANNTSYTISGTSSQGCAAQLPAISNVTVVPAPVISAPDATICAGQTHTISPAGAVTYTFLNSSPVVSPTVNATYSVVGTNLMGCNSISPTIVQISVNSSPQVTATGGSICAGQSFTIQASGALSYSFSSGPAVSPTVTTSYSVTGTDANNCVSLNPAISTVTVYQLPLLSLISSTNILCSGATATIICSGANSYTFNTGGSVIPSSSGQIVVNPTVTTVYVALGESAEGCINSSSLTQSVEICTGLTESALSNYFNLYPNPNNGTFKVKTEVDITVRIINVLGQIVYTDLFQAGTNEVSMNELANGIYDVYLSTENGNANIKMVKE